MKHFELKCICIPVTQELLDTFASEENLEAI